MPRAKLILVLMLLAMFTRSLIGRINVVTLPARDSVQLTIYNSVDLTMVKETRFLTLRKGMNRLEFSWANTLIDPTSVEFKALKQGDQVEVLDVRFPPRVSNTLEWHVQSEVSGEVQIEIQYFTSGVSWSAAYVAEVAQDERTMKLDGAVRVTNKSGEDYENAQVRLVVGVIRLVEDIAALSGPKPTASERKEMQTVFKGWIVDPAVGAFGGAGGSGQGLDRKKEVTKESLSEYYLYTVEGRDTIPNGWSKKLPSFSTPGVFFASYYKYEKERYGENVNRFYAFTNNVAGHLGKEPLPEGRLDAFRLVSPDASYAFHGASSFKYIPVDEKVELQLGLDAEVQVHPRMTSWEKQDLHFNNDGNLDGWTIKQTWEIDLQNSKSIPVMVDVRRNFTGDWALNSTPLHEKMDTGKVKFLVPLAAHAQDKISYTLTIHHGANATR